MVSKATFFLVTTCETHVVQGEASNQWQSSDFSDKFRKLFSLFNWKLLQSFLSRFGFGGCHRRLAGWLSCRCCCFCCFDSSLRRGICCLRNGRWYRGGVQWIGRFRFWSRLHREGWRRWSGSPLKKNSKSSEVHSNFQVTLLLFLAELSAQLAWFWCCSPLTRLFAGSIGSDGKSS